MRFHSEQVDTLTRERRQQALAGLVERLRARWPARCLGLDDASLDSLVEEARALGEEVQLTSRSGLETLAHCRLVFGPPPWPRRFAWPLGDGDRPALARNQAFLKEADEALRAEEERAR